MVNLCEICAGRGWIPRSDPAGATVGFAYRCRCNPETPESVMHGYSVTKRVEHRPEHPEVALGIPAIIVTAKPNHKAFMAKRCQYDGPLTIAEVVALGTVARENAIGMVKYWIQEGGDVPTGNALIQSL